MKKNFLFHQLLIAVAVVKVTEFCLCGSYPFYAYSKTKFILHPLLAMIV